MSVLESGGSVNICLQKDRPAAPPNPPTEGGSEAAGVTGGTLLRGRVPVRPHAEGLQAFALGEHVVEALHQRHRLVDAHLDAPQDHGHLVDFLDLLGVLGVAFLPLLHDAEQGLNRQIHLQVRQALLELLFNDI